MKLSIDKSNGVYVIVSTNQFRTSNRRQFDTLNELIDYFEMVYQFQKIKSLSVSGDVNSELVSQGVNLRTKEI